MMQKPISAAEGLDMEAVKPVPVRLVIITLDSHLAAVCDRACRMLRAEIPGLQMSLHAACEWERNPDALARAKADIAEADFIVAAMMFVDQQIKAILPDLLARREACDAMVGAVSIADIIKLTKLGDFRMDQTGGPIALLKRLRGGKKNAKKGGTPGASQMAMLRRLPQILRFIPGKAQDVRAYFMTLQYWLAGTDDNVANMVRALINRYAAGERAHLKGTLKVAAPREFPDTGLYHPTLKDRVADRLDKLPKPKKGAGSAGTVGLLVMRSYVLADDSRHYDAVIAALEARGLKVIPAFASGLDARPAIEQFFIKDGAASVDAVLSLTGFSLVGGPAYNDSSAAEEVLAGLDVPYIAAHAVEFQSIAEWEASEQGLMPVEATIMVSIPELDGATGPMVFAGRDRQAASRDMMPVVDRVEQLSSRVARIVALRRKARAERKLGIILFNFPPNAGATGTAAFLDVFASLHNSLKRLKAEGYAVDVPESVAALREAVLGGNSARFGTDANVAAHIATDDYVAGEPYLNEIEAQWGPSPGKALANGRGIFILGAQFGNVFVGIQPGFGYEGDPMRLLFEKSFAPTHAFSAFYRWLNQDFGADALLHFGTHGALEFMPGKQTGLTSACWPDRLIGALPNFYLYAANNPSEGMIAKRRGAATLVSYLTPPLTQAGLYKGLAEIKSSIERWRSAPDDEVLETIRAQAEALDLIAEGEAEIDIAGLNESIVEMEHSLIPHGLHIIGDVPSEAEQADLVTMLADGLDADQLDKVRHQLQQETELPGIIRALDGRFVPPAPGGDLIRTPEILPTGRNVHGFDPFKLPSSFALADGFKQADRLLGRHKVETWTEMQPYPRSVAMVLWGTDNLKSEGGPIAQAMALLGARPRFDGYRRLCGAELIPLEELGRPRIDVVMTLSGIFRDLLPLQTKMLAEATWLAASAEDEPLEQNYVRAHALSYAEAQGCDLETAALRIFSNDNGAYGSNVNLLLDSGRWNDEDELAEQYTSRKCFAYGRTGEPAEQGALLNRMLADVDLTYQNLESVELGVTTIDHYFDTLGGISRAVKRSKGSDVPVYIGDQTTGAGKVRTLDEQVSLETRTRMLNPKWYEGMLDHGAEGVRQIEASITNTLGWSATTGKVAPWVYEKLTETFVLDDEMRARLAQANPKASARLAERLIEAHERAYWQPDDETLERLREAGEDLEDRLEGVTPAKVGVQA